MIFYQYLMELSSFVMVEVVAPRSSEMIRQLEKEFMVV